MKFLQLKDTQACVFHFGNSLCFFKERVILKKKHFGKHFGNEFKKVQLWIRILFSKDTYSIRKPSILCFAVFGSRNDKNHAHLLCCHESERSLCSLNWSHCASMSVHNKETKYDIYLYPETLPMMVVTCGKNPWVFYVRKQKIQKCLQNSAFEGL